MIYVGAWHYSHCTISRSAASIWRTSYVVQYTFHLRDMAGLVEQLPDPCRELAELPGQALAMRAEA